MKENKRNDRNDDLRQDDDDQLRSNTTNETIREVSGDPDIDLNELKDTGDEMGRSTNRGSGGVLPNTGVRRGSASNLTPKTGVSGSDLDGQTA